MSTAQLLKNIFPNSLDRDHFVYILKQCTGDSPRIWYGTGETGKSIINSPPRTWHWYGTGNNGKTTLINALLKEYPIERLPSDSESEEVYQLSDETIIRITNFYPKYKNGDIITEFKTVFN